MNRPEFAPTEFFARQDAARARTGKLVFLFIVAMAGTVAAVYGAARLCFGAANSGVWSRSGHYHAGYHTAISAWNPTLFLGCLIGTLVVVGGASLYKSAQLSEGGGAVAESVNGRKVEQDTTDVGERILLNVVSEMALAATMPVPEVYILDDEPGINAFAAGNKVENAAIAVTRGALEKLSRDELQAVIGHEFSHILNGDMRLNIRLAGWIFGLLALTVIGRVIFAFAPDTRSRRDDKDGSGNIGFAFMIFGLLLLVIGFIGNLFAQMIQALISRQREVLADASSTQFTRNPEALANALRRIAGDGMNTYLRNPHAAEIAHMCFGEGVSSPFATHPPLEERIRALKPDWDGTSLPPLDPVRQKSRMPADDATADSNFGESFMRNSTAPGAGAATSSETPPELPPVAVPARVAALISEPLGAQAALLLLMMADNPVDNTAQAVLLKRRVSPELFEKLKSAWGLADMIPMRDRLAVARLAAPALRRLPSGDSSALLEALRALADHDGEASAFENDLYAFVAGTVNSGGSVT